MSGRTGAGAAMAAAASGAVGGRGTGAAPAAGTAAGAGTATSAGVGAVAAGALVQRRTRTATATDADASGAVGGRRTDAAPAAGVGAVAAGEVVRRRTRTVAAAAAALVGAVMVAGCGIRSTTVPVDAGVAPSRVSCAAPARPATPPAGTVIRHVYLVCSMQVAPVTRSVQVPVDGSTDTFSPSADLLTQLQVSPLDAESKAGFSTAVPGSLYLARPLDSDPKGALRLSQAVDELPSFALAQIVCTLVSDPAIAPDHAVVLGGPGNDQLRRYTCTADLLTRADAAESAGTPVQ